MIAPAKPFPIEANVPAGYEVPAEAIELIAELLLDLVDRAEPVGAEE